MVACAAAAFAENTDTVRLVYHHCCIILLGKADNLRKIRDISLHREDSVGNYEFHLVRVAFL